MKAPERPLAQSIGASSSIRRVAISWQHSVIWLQTACHPDSCPARAGTAIVAAAAVGEEVVIMVTVVLMELPGAAADPSAAPWDGFSAEEGTQSPDPAVAWSTGWSGMQAKATTMAVTRNAV